MLVSDSGLLKVTDFGTSRFLEIAAHGTTVIGSPPYMAPEQFHGKAVFASDIYSLGVTMYQMLTGALPYDTPSPADLDRLMRGELCRPPRLKNPQDPEGHQRHRPQGAGARPDDALSARRRSARRRAGRPARLGSGARERRMPSEPAVDDVHVSRAAQGAGAPDIQSRLRRSVKPPQRAACAGTARQARSHARADRCPFCSRSAVAGSHRAVARPRLGCLVHYPTRAPIDSPTAVVRIRIGFGRSGPLWRFRGPARSG